MLLASTHLHEKGLCLSKQCHLHPRFHSKTRSLVTEHTTVKWTIIHTLLLIIIGAVLTLFTNNLHEFTEKKKKKKQITEALSWLESYFQPICIVDFNCAES